MCSEDTCAQTTLTTLICLLQSQPTRFAWNEAKLKLVRAALRADGLSDNDIDAKMYYDVAWFRARVERVVLPPSQLYWRVRAVFEIYGPMQDQKTGKPLFGDEAWKKANGVLKEILLGHCSDHPGLRSARSVLCHSMHDARARRARTTRTHGPRPLSLKSGIFA